MYPRAGHAKHHRHGRIGSALDRPETLQTGSDESVITKSKQKTGTHLLLVCAPPSPQSTITIDHCLKRLETSSCNEHTWAMRNISSTCIRSWHQCADCTKRFYFESGFEFEGKAGRAGPKSALPALLTCQYSFLWQLPSAPSGYSCFPPDCALDAGARLTV